MKIRLLAIACLLAACSSPRAAPPKASPAPAAKAAPSPTPSPSASPTPSPVPSPPPALASTAKPAYPFRPDRAMGHVNVLASVIGPRTAGSEANRRATGYVEEMLTNAGYSVRRQTFSLPQGGTADNVIARHPAADYSGGYLIVGAHFDTVKDSPGANDNGSGTAVMITLAEELISRRVPVEFIGFNAEERQPNAPSGRTGLTHGSRAYVEAMKPTDKLLAMLSIDMVGNGPSVLLVKLSGHADVIRTELARVASASKIPHTLSSKGDVSDHAVFARRGVPTAFLYAGNHPSFHKPSDVYSVVRRQSVEWTGQIAGGWLLSRTGS